MVINFRLASLGTSTFLLVASWLATPSPALAQTASPPAPPRTGAPARSQQAQAPASIQTMLNLRIAGAVVACELAITEKMPLQKAVSLVSQGITQSVAIANNLQIEGAGKLTLEQIGEGAAINVILTLRGSQCYGKFSAPDKKFVDNIISQLQKQTSQQKPPVNPPAQ